MAYISVDFERAIGKIKPMHAVGQPPFLGMDFSYIEHLKRAHIPFSRLHDVGGPFGGFVFVDIPNLFRDFDADESLPESYDFAFTDKLIESLMKNECEPVFRLGITIENHRTIKAYRVYPPKDPKKWARICEHVVRHYTEGWANGYSFPIRYWEIWNEPESFNPDKNPMWSGTHEQFFDLYTEASKHLKSCFGDKIKIGGYGATGFWGIFSDYEKYQIPKHLEQDDEFLERARSPHAQNLLNFFFKFLAHIKKHNAPLEFFSWHSYLNIENTKAMSAFVHRTLSEYGYDDVETHINEWNNGRRLQRGTSEPCAKAAAFMCAMQDSDEQMLCYYDARIGVSIYGGMFNPITYEPFCTYYSFYAFGQLYALGNQVHCTVDADNVYALAASNENERAVVISNISGEDREFTTNLPADMKVYAIDEDNFCVETELSPSSFTIKNNQVFLIK